MRPFFSVTAAVAAVFALSSGGEAFASPKGCPPGLAKKSSHCSPPGKSSKHSHDSHRDYGRKSHDSHSDYVRKWSRGDVLPDGARYVIIDRKDWARYGLPQRDDNSRYALMGNEILRLSPDTQNVLSFVRLLGGFAN